MSELLRVADAVTSTLNAATLSLPFVAERHYQPVFDLAEMNDLHVTVVPKGVEVKEVARSKATRDYTVDVAVQRKFEVGDATELDPLMRLVEEIAEGFTFRRLADYPGAAWVKTEYVSIFAQEHMRELRQFTSVLTLTFRVVR
ncbi:MAG: hypothetical protein V1809_01905 [Planctomycetota bacterium]